MATAQSSDKVFTLKKEGNEKRNRKRNRKRTGKKRKGKEREQRIEEN
jgi:hypothetical protein